MIRRTGAVLVGAFVAGCTAGGGAEPRSGMGEGETQAAGQAIAQASHSDARDFRLAGDGVTAFAGGCSSSFPASPADADNDNIPDVLTVITYSNCTEGGFTFSGTQTLQDQDTAQADFEFQSTWDIDSTGTVAGHDVDLSYQAVLTASGGTSGTFTLSDAADIVTAVSGPDTNGTVEDAHVWSVSFTPDDGVWTPAPGLPLEDGDFELDGPWDVTLDGGLEITGIVSTQTMLRTSAACPTSIVSGAVQVLVGEPEQGTLAVTWTTCGTFSTTFTPLPGI